MFLSALISTIFTLVAYNCENLFDCRHDSLKEDTEFLPDGPRQWTPHRYWTKLNNVCKVIMACGTDGDEQRIPDLIALVEVENDSVLQALTRRSPLRALRYDYLMTSSPDERGMDVALLYAPPTFRPLSHRSLRVPPPPGSKPSRDVLYVCGEIQRGDTLHVFVIHAPSRVGGPAADDYRMRVGQTVAHAVDSIRRLSADAKVILAGDFNEPLNGEVVGLLGYCHLQDLTKSARGVNGAKATYRYKGDWEMLDHVLISPSLSANFRHIRIEDSSFLTEEDRDYGGLKPRRTYVGRRYHGGISDHLPLVVIFDF